MEAVRIYQGNEEALRSGQGRLANAYRTYCEQGNSDRQQLNVNVDAGAPISAGERHNRLDTLAEIAHRRLRTDYVADPCTDGVQLDLGSDASEVRNDGLVNPPESHRAARDLMTTTQAQNMQTPVAPWTYGIAAQCVPTANNGSTLFSDHSKQAGLAVMNFEADSTPNLDDLWSEEWYPPLYDEFYELG